MYQISDVWINLNMVISYILSAIKLCKRIWCVIKNRLICVFWSSIRKRSQPNRLFDTKVISKEWQWRKKIPFYFISKEIFNPLPSICLRVVKYAVDIWRCVQTMDDEFDFTVFFSPVEWKKKEFEHVSKNDGELIMICHSWWMCTHAHTLKHTERCLCSVHSILFCSISW